MQRVLTRIKTVIDVFPETDFNITVGHLSGIFEQLDAGDADLAFTPILQADLRHQTRTVGQISMITVAAPGTWCRAPMKPSLSSVSSNIIRSWCGEQRGPCPAPVFG